MKNIINIIFIALFLVLTSSCAMFKPVPDSLTISINSASDLNPDAEERASPLVLRIYELSDIKRFNSSDFFDIFDNDKETLAAALVKKTEMTFNPNESRKLDIVLNEKTKYIGFLAAYRDIDSAKWREVAAITSKKPSGIPVYGKRGFNVDLNKNKIVVVGH